MDVFEPIIYVDAPAQIDIFFNLLFATIILMPIITAVAIKKAKGKYLRTFFDNIVYSTIPFFVIISVFEMFCHYEKHSVIILYIIVFLLFLFSILSFCNRKILKIVKVIGMITVLYGVMLLLMNVSMLFEGIGFITAVFIFNSILIYFTILIYNFFKFIVSKLCRKE